MEAFLIYLRYLDALKKALRTICYGANILACCVATALTINERYLTEAKRVIGVKPGDLGYTLHACARACLVDNKLP